jgi:FMN-dependent NADH-azoreductase
MATVLRIDSSMRTDHSVSRHLTGKFLAAWKRVHPRDRVVERDLATNPAPHVTEQTMGAMFTPPSQRSATQSQDAALADELIEESLAADVLVIGAPMYNLSVSSSLKAWIDHVARAGATFKYTENGPVGLITGRKAYVFTARSWHPNAFNSLPGSARSRRR